MGLTSGTKLGRYEIVSALGAGGMGEVYRARDTRLDRTVAIKMLNSSLAASPKLKARLQAATSSGKPVLLRVNYGGGHGLIGATLQQVQESRADSRSFLLWQLGDPEFQPNAKTGEQ